MRKSKDVSPSALNLKGHQRTSYVEHLALMGQDSSPSVALTRSFIFYILAAEQIPIAIPAGCCCSLGRQAEIQHSKQLKVGCSLASPRDRT